MTEEERLYLIEEYSFKVIHNNFPFDQVRPELVKLGLEEEDISRIVKEVDDLLLLNTVEPKLERSRLTFEKSGVGVLVSIFLLLLSLASSYGMIEVENIESVIIITLALLLTFFLYKKVKKPKGKFENKNKFKND